MTETTKRGNRRASYRRKKNGRWAVRWRSPITGKQRCHTCPTAAAARLVRGEVEEALATGRDWSARQNTGGHVALLLARYVDNLEKSRHPSTIKRLESFADDFVAFLQQRERYSGDLPLELLTSEVADDYDRALFERGNAIRTRRGKIGLLRNAWTWGLSRPEFSGRLGMVVPVVDIPEPIDAIPQAPTWAQCDAAIRAMHRPGYREPFVYRVALACRFLGLRPTQAAHLRRHHFDLQARSLTITRDLPGTKTPQERRGRTIPYPATFHGILLGWLAASPDDYVIPGPPKRALQKQAARKAWERSEAPAKVWQGQPLKAFRKAFETELVAAGADYLAVERLVGHALTGAGRSYVASRAFWDRMVLAVSLIPIFPVPTPSVLRLSDTRAS